ncbi:MAG: phosphonate C-P lyase system protein PhnG [Methanosarcinales archaeon]|nr:MAG: phosphonate C-P lyase system protein PhnG [Methanosarcinales archaeon]
MGVQFHQSTHNWRRGSEMNRDKRFELIARADSERICEIAERILADTAVEVIKKPMGGMIMMRFRDTAEKCIFNLGEVLVTEAEVRINEELGYAMIIGKNPESALAGAILDAAVESGHPITPEIMDLLKSEELRINKELQKTWAKVATTKVDFEVMV